MSSCKDTTLSGSKCIGPGGGVAKDSLSRSENGDGEGVILPVLRRCLQICIVWPEKWGFHAGGLVTDGAFGGTIGSEVVHGWAGLPGLLVSFSPCRFKPLLYIKKTYHTGGEGEKRFSAGFYRAHCMHALNYSGRVSCIIQYYILSIAMPCGTCNNSRGHVSNCTQERAGVIVYIYN